MQQNALLLTIAISRYIACAECSSNRRIINGTNVPPNQLQYVVSLESVESLVPGSGIYRICTGSLISSRWIVTAAHCFLARRSIIIRYGDMTTPRNRSRTFSLVLKQITHPSFGLYAFSSFKEPLRRLKNDIGLMRVLKINILEVGRLSAVDFNALLGTRVKYAGYGLTQFAVNRKDRLKYAVLDNLKSLQLGKGVIIKCPLIHPSPVTPCLGLVPGCLDLFHDSAPADSGGPVLFEGKIIGMTCCSAGRSVGIITPISPFLGWIESTLLSPT